MAKISRRDFNKLSTGGVALGLGGVVTGTVPSVVRAASGGESVSISGTAGRPAELPGPKGHRVVVVGGGWSGLTIAKYLKVNDPNLDVVLIEKKSVFASHPISNLWLAGLTGLETLVHSYLDAAANNGYIYFNASLIDLDRSARRVFTDQGWLDYDDLVLAPGVDYEYASFGVDDPEAIQLLKTRYPAAVASASEHVSLYHKVNGFKGGIFLLTAPPGIYRCSAAPYERACMIASVFKRRNIKGKVVLVDSREEPAVKADGFVAAFDELYADQIEYMTSTGVSGVDPFNRTLTTDFDDIEFADAAIYPRTRGARLLEHLGLADAKSAQMEASIDHFTYNVTLSGRVDQHVYIAGDCRPMPFSKSGNTARTEAKYLAKLIAARASGKEAAWESPHTICYSVVNADPLEAIMVNGKYKFDEASKQWEHHENYALNERDEEKGQNAFAWADEHYQDMFG